LAENSTDLLSAIDYWKARESEWPHLSAMAFDFLSIPAMSSECERVFSSCGEMITPKNSKLSGKLLWHGQCLNNWQRRGAIQMELWKNAVILDLT
jgi:hypothetical protein